MIRMRMRNEEGIERSSAKSPDLREAIPTDFLWMKSGIDKDSVPIDGVKETIGSNLAAAAKCDKLYIWQSEE